jgi:hypothetical protein
MQSDDSESDLLCLSSSEEESGAILTYDLCTFFLQDNGFLQPEFGLEQWPVSNFNKAILDNMVESKGWLTNPLHAYCEGNIQVIPLTEYESAL